MNTFKDNLTKKKFIFTAEITPPKGTDLKEFTETAKILKNYVTAVNITDNPRSVMKLGSLSACKILIDNGIEPIFQITCRDRNRIAVQSDMLSAWVLGIRNMLITTGDNVLAGDHKSAKPVFDVDSTQMLYIAKQLNLGFDLEKNNLQKELERIHIEICEGANNACLKAILFKQLFHNELPVITILDYDANGEKIYKAMTKDFKFQGKKEVVKYDQYVKASGADVEAEDLFPGTLLKKFLKNHEGALSEKILRPENKSKRQFHYGLTETGKKEFLEWLPKNSKKSDYRNWLRLIEDIRKRYDKIKK